MVLVLLLLLNTDMGQKMNKKTIENTYLPNVIWFLLETLAPTYTSYLPALTVPATVHIQAPGTAQAAITIEPVRAQAIQRVQGHTVG